MMTVAEDVPEEGNSFRRIDAPIGVGIRPKVLVTVPVLTLLGRSEEPGTLEGYGPIDADTARRIAARAPSFTRILTHPETGAVLSVGRDRYAVPRDLRTWLRVRDETCRFPGCNRSAGRTDVDHVTDWQYGGGTDYGNLVHLCRSHHRLKHHTAWSSTSTGGGRVRWLSPSGHEYQTAPATHIRPPTRKRLQVQGSRPPTPEEPRFQGHRLGREGCCVASTGSATVGSRLPIRRVRGPTGRGTGRDFATGPIRSLSPSKGPDPDARVRSPAGGSRFRLRCDTPHPGAPRCGVSAFQPELRTVRGAGRDPRSPRNSPAHPRSPSRARPPASECRRPRSRCGQRSRACGKCPDRPRACTCGRRRSRAGPG